MLYFYSNYLKENYPYIILYLILQIPLVIFSWNFAFLIFLFDNIVFWHILTIVLWQIFLIGIMYIVIINRLFIKIRIERIEKRLSSVETDILFQKR